MILEEDSKVFQSPKGFSALQSALWIHIHTSQIKTSHSLNPTAVLMARIFLSSRKWLELG
jgi:hypothetical protein